MNIRAVFFDKDGTLALVDDYLRCLTNIVLQELEPDLSGEAELLRSRYGVFPDGVDPNGLMAVGSRQACAELAVKMLVDQGIDAAKALTRVQSTFRVAERSLPRKASLTPLVPGILELLTQLRQQQIPIGILTSDSPANLHDFIAYHHLAHRIQLAWGSEPGKLSKPDPKFYQKACQQLGVLPRQTVMIGDAESDCQMATQVGAQAIGVTWGWRGDRKPQFPSDLIQLTQIQAIQVRFNVESQSV